MTLKEDKRIAYETRQIDKLHEKVNAYTTGEIDRYNVVRNIAFAMQQIAKKKLVGSKKKEIVKNIILKLINPNSFPVELMDTIIDNFIEDIYTSFNKSFTKRGCF